MLEFKSHFMAGTGAICVQTLEEGRLIACLLEQVEPLEMMVISAPSGSGVCVGLADDGSVSYNTEPTIKGGSGTLALAYEWASASGSRLLLVRDWHCINNNPIQWRMLLDWVDRVRCPQGGGGPSLIVFVGKVWDFSPQSMIAQQIPVVDYKLPDRAELLALVSRLSAANSLDMPDTDAIEVVIDSLIGLSLASAEQAVAECLVRNSRRWDVPTLLQSKELQFRQAGLNVWKPNPSLGGFSGISKHFDNDVVPHVRDDQLGIRRILLCGVPGVGKSYCATVLAHRLGWLCLELSLEKMKGSLVGSSVANVARCFATIDAAAPCVVVLDELDKVASTGLDGGASAGIFGETLKWLEESKTCCIVIATLNNMDGLDAAMSSRFDSQWFFDIPVESERIEVARIHYTLLGCDPDSIDAAATLTGSITEGFSNREIARRVCKAVAMDSSRNPTEEIIRAVVARTPKTMSTHRAQIEKMREAAVSLRRANDPIIGSPVSRRKISNN
jgi:hypothetical protein